MNLVTILNVVASFASATIWLLLFFALFTHAGALLRAAIVMLPTGGYVNCILAIGGAYTPTLADLFVNVGVICATLWVAQRKVQHLARYRRFDSWV